MYAAELDSSTIGFSPLDLVESPRAIASADDDIALEEVAPLLERESTSSSATLSLARAPTTGSAYDKTYRVRGIPAAFTEEDTRELLCSILRHDNADPQPRVHSLGPDPYSLERTAAKVATVTFKGTPESLSGALDEWTWPATELEASDGRPAVSSITIDSHFRGFTPLNSIGDGIDHKMDCIAITGLSSHPFGSWKQRGGQHMWLRDSLPRDLQGARVLLYGYDTNLFQSQSFQDITDIAITFSRSIRSIRSSRKDDSETKPVPIVFIAHSLGGLVLKEAIIRIRGGNKVDRDNFNSIYGALFFGVPNRGIRIGHWLQMVNGQPNEGLVKKLRPGSRYLRELSASFNAAFTFPDSEIISIYETEKTRTAREESPGIWTLTGNHEILVARHSATDTRLSSGQGHRVLPIKQNHSDMVKFASEWDENYRLVVSHLREFGANAMSVIQRRFSQDKAHEPIHNPEINRKKLKGPNGDSIAEDMWLLEEQNHKGIHSVSTPESGAANDLDVAARRKEKLLRNLRIWLAATDFDHIRREKQWLEGTCEWILQKEQYKAWIAQPGRVLWVHGIPGCGKSVLASFLITEISKVHPMAYFFCRNDEERKRMPAYIVATLIHQLLGHPNLAEFQDQVFNLASDVYNSCPDMSTISIDRLCALLQRIIELLPSLVLLVDALDECAPEGSSRDFLQSRLMLFAQEYPNLKVLLISRYEEPFIETLEGRGHVIRIDRTDVADDIRAVVTKSVSENTKLRKLEYRITTALLEGADGMFLWAELMLHTLKTARNSKAVERMLEDLPVGLDGVYCQILTNIGRTLTEEELLLRREIFGWITTAARPMTLDELSTALAIEAGNTRLDEGNVPLDLRTDIRKLCGPLVQIFDRNVVQIVHISVKEMLWKTPKGSADSGPSYIMHYQPEVEHSRVTFTCLTYLGFEVLQTKEAIGGLVDGDEYSHSLASDNKLLEYVTLNWVYHLTNSGGEGACLLALAVEFLQSLNCFAWLELFTAFISMERENFAHHFQLRSRLLGWFSSIDLPDGEKIKETLTHYLVNAVLSGLKTSEQLFGLEDLRTLKVAQRLGCLYDHEDRIQDGAASHEKIISSSSHVKDPQTQHIVRKSCIELAWLHFVRENYPKSITLLEQALGGSDPSDWIHDILGAEAMADLANVYRQQNQLGLAQELMEDAVRGLGHFRGLRHVLTIRYTVELCRIYCLQKDYKRAETLLRSTLKVADECLGNEHPRALHGRSLLASIMHENGDSDGAAEILEEVVRLFIKVWGPRGRSVAKAKVDLAAVLVDQGKLSNAATHYTEAVDIYEEVLGHLHSLTIEAATKLAWCQKEIKEIL